MFVVVVNGVTSLKCFKKNCMEMRYLSTFGYLTLRWFDNLVKG